MFKQLTKTNTFKLIIEFCIWMKISFSSLVTPSPPNKVAKHLVDAWLFPTLRKGEGEAAFHKRESAEFKRREKVGNSQVSRQLLFMIVGKLSLIVNFKINKTLHRLNSNLQRVPPKSRVFFWCQDHKWTQSNTWWLWDYALPSKRY